MGYGEIINRAWKITWKYRALWVLGLFAGITGGSSGGGSNGSYRSPGSRTGSGSNPFANLTDTTRWAEQIGRVLPVLIAIGVLLFVIGIVLWILGVAARGGLMQAVNAIEEGQPFTLGAAWSAGFGRFWRLFGLSFLLGLPLLLVVLVLGVFVVVPIVLPLIRGGAPSAAVFVPVCGALLIGLPLLIVGGVILGIMREMGQRSIMLDGLGVFEAIDAGWRSFRTRIKDTLLMWLINLGLNIVSSIVIAIPVVVVVVAAVIPVALTARSGSYGAMAGISIVGVAFLTVLVMFYTAIWGTFTSTLWTIFYRRFTSREVLAQQVAPPAPPAAPESPAAENPAADA